MANRQIQTRERTQNNGLVAWLEGQRVRLPLKGVECHFTVRGGVADVQVDQIFLQENRQALDCTYLFPLPADAAVYRCEVIINERVIKARVEERQTALRIAREQKAAGHRVALVEAERPNLFTLTLGNIQPQDLVVVQLAYLQPLHRLLNEVTLQIPTCPGVRYIPGEPLLRTNRGIGPADDTAQVPDASRITVPRIERLHPDAAYLSIEGRLEAGSTELSSINSPSHDTLSRRREDEIKVHLNDRRAVPDQDFVVRWLEPTASTMQTRAWYSDVDGQRYALLEIRAPQAIQAGDVSPQDVYFLVDRSGSMQGLKWHKAVQAVQACVASLNPQDRAWITLFSNGHQDFAEAPIQRDALLTDENFRKLKDQNADGGTELASALDHLLQELEAHSSGRRKCVVLITDGQVGNESHILELARQAPAVAFYCFGIDIALNDYLLSRLATQQQGLFFSLHPNDNMTAIVGALGRSLSQPVLTALSVDKDWLPVDGVVPDLYAGQVIYLPLQCLGRHDSVGVTALDTAGTVVRLAFKLTPVADHSPWRVWARRRMDYFKQRREVSQLSELSRKANLICEHTAFIAWDESQKVAMAQHSLAQPAFNMMLKPLVTMGLCASTEEESLNPFNYPPPTWLTQDESKELTIRIVELWIAHIDGIKTQQFAAYAQLQSLLLDFLIWLRSEAVCRPLSFEQWSSFWAALNAEVKPHITLLGRIASTANIIASRCQDMSDALAGAGAGTPGKQNDYAQLDQTLDRIQKACGTQREWVQSLRALLEQCGQSCIRTERLLEDFKSNPAASKVVAP